MHNFVKSSWNIVIVFGTRKRKYLMKSLWSSSINLSIGFCVTFSLIWINWIFSYFCVSRYSSDGRGSCCFNYYRDGNQCKGNGICVKNKIEIVRLKQS